MNLTSRSHVITWLLVVAAGCSRRTEGFLLVSPPAVARISKHARHDRRRCGVSAVDCSADHVSSSCCPRQRRRTSSTNKQLQTLLLRQRRSRRIALHATETAGEKLSQETETTGTISPHLFGVHSSQMRSSCTRPLFPLARNMQSSCLWVLRWKKWPRLKKRSRRTK